MERMKVRATLLTDMLGTQPADEKVFQTYIASKAPETTGPEEVGVDPDALEEKGTTVYRRHPDTGNLCLCDYHIKGALKARGDAIRARKAKGDKEAKGNWGSIKGKLDEDLHVFPRYIDLGKDKPDTILERPLRAQTMQGPRVSLARSEVVTADTQFEFEIAWMPGRIDRKMIIEMLDEMKFMGLGQWRNAGYGRVDIEVDLGKGYVLVGTVAEAA